MIVRLSLMMSWWLGLMMMAVVKSFSELDKAVNEGRVPNVNEVLLTMNSLFW